jgi:hypothetical protein
MRNACDDRGNLEPSDNMMAGKQLIKQDGYLTSVREWKQSRASSFAESYSSYSKLKKKEKMLRFLYLPFQFVRIV